MEPKSAKSLGHQGQVIKEHPLCGLAAGFSKAAGQYSEQGTPACLRKACGKCHDCHDYRLQQHSRTVSYVCVHTGFRLGVTGSVASHTPQPQLGGGGVLQLSTLADVSWGVDKCHNCSCLAAPGREQGTAATTHTPASARQ